MLNQQKSNNAGGMSLLAVLLAMGIILAAALVAFAAVIKTRQATTDLARLVIVAELMQELAEKMRQNSLATTNGSYDGRFLPIKEDVNGCLTAQGAENCSDIVSAEKADWLARLQRHYPAAQVFVLKKSAWQRDIWLILPSDAVGQKVASNYSCEQKPAALAVEQAAVCLRLTVQLPEESNMDTTESKLPTM